MGEYLGQQSWQVEHVFANHPERYADEIADVVEFRVLRNRIGVLVLLQSNDNASFRDLPYGRKVPRYVGHNQLAAVLAPPNREWNPRLRTFIAGHGLEKLFHDYGSSPQLRIVVEGRGQLYRELCRRVWSAQSLGLRLPWENRPPVAAVIDAPMLSGEPIETRVPDPVEPRRRGPVPQMIQLTEVGLLPNGAVLRAVVDGQVHTAVIDGGRILLPTGDRYRLPDEAAAVVRGRKNVRGMMFWSVESRPGQWTTLRELYDQAKKQGRLGSAKRRQATP
jgi:hypothetical protein